MALSITGFLLATATVVVLVLEWANPATLGGLDVPGKLLASLFQAVTPRTAGFHTLDYAGMQAPTLLFTALLMFIGGNPGSTAGGIKTLTFFVLVVSVWSVVRQRREYTIYGRRIASDTVVRAGVVAFGGVMLAGAALTLLAITERDIALLPLLFETVSALGTVGLSLGITADLSPLGRVVMIVLMYLGRIGLLTFALALVTEHPTRQIRYPAGDVVIG
jgi:trk system potassium uptake protein TrkH